MEIHEIIFNLNNSTHAIPQCHDGFKTFHSLNINYCNSILFFFYNNKIKKKNLLLLNKNLPKKLVTTFYFILICTRLSPVCH